MKNICIAIIVLLLPVTLMGQEQYQEEIKIPLSNPNKPGALEIELHNGSVQVEAYNGQEVLVNIQFPASQGRRASTRDGLRRIPNQALDVDITEEDNVIEIDGGQKRADFLIKVPQQFGLHISTHHNGDVVVTGVNGEMVIDCHHGGMTLTDVGGSLVGDTHHGEIKASFTTIADRPMAFSTYHGDVDVTFPSTVACDVKIKSERGDIFTDFEIDLKPNMPTQEVTGNGRREIKIGGWMHGSIGNGGKEFMFNTYHGDVILRKS